MSAESKPLFHPGLQPEKSKPDRVNLLPKIELTREEKVTSLAKQMSSLTVFRMSGLTEKITKENFPDIPDDHLEEACYYSDTVMVGALNRDAQEARNSELEALIKGKSAELERKRNERYKAYLKKDSKAPTLSEPEPKTPSRIPQPVQHAANTGQYL